MHRLAFPSHKRVASTILLLASVSVFGVSAPKHAASRVAVSPIFSDHAVLQRDGNAAVWGTADPSSGDVSVSVAGSTAIAVVKSDGTWRAELHGIPPGGPYTMTVSGQNTIVIRDVAIGDVFLVSGQSNMAYAMWKDARNKANAAAAHDAWIRFFVMPKHGSAKPETNPAARWYAVRPGTVLEDSAVGYYFAKQVRAHEHVPVGIIEAAVGETPAESWISPQAIEAHPELLTFVPELQRWANASGHDLWRYEPGWLYNAMISPIVGYGISAIIWYQGENNSWPQYHERTYAPLLSLLISDWRDKWRAQIPFTIIQLAAYHKAWSEPVSWSGVAAIREAQLRVDETMSKTNLVVTVDLPNPDEDVHPIDKWDVGWRAAMATLYGAAGPEFTYASIDGSQIRAYFQRADGGLVAKGGPLRRFEVAGSGGKFEPAFAQIDGNSVVISSPIVPHPAVARYAWADNPSGANLYNAAGYPASPFTTAQP
jgi:sialate O-acetylesterase